MSRLVLLAVGGNALMRSGERGLAEHQFAHALETAAAVVRLIRAGYRVVLTHGNAPQIGAALTRSDLAAAHAYRMPYDCCVAATQGEIGYVLQYALWQMLQKENLHVPVVSLITQVRVEKDDPAFTRPTKPIGQSLSEQEATALQESLGWSFRKDARGRYRRIVPSPEPLEIIELDAIRACVDRGLVVIAAGGGGIPVFNDHDNSKGVEAVIDKDLTSAILASQLNADCFVIATGEPFVFIDYGKPTQRAITHLSVHDCVRFMAEGQFPEGSMRPKIRAATLYLERGGTEAIITDIDHVEEALSGEAGTHIQLNEELEAFDWP